MRIVAPAMSETTYTRRVFRVMGIVACASLAVLAAAVWMLGRTVVTECSSPLVAALDQSACQRVTFIHDVSALVTLVAAVSAVGLFLRRKR